MKPHFTIITATTNDFTIIADLPQSSSHIKKEMGGFFKLVDLGPISWLLGVSVSHDPKNRTIALDQETYIDQILTHFRLNKA